MSSLPKRLRFEILKRDRFACVYCGQGMPAVVVEVDHVLARANGGTDDPSNLVTACFSCNRGKSDVPLEVALPGVTPESVEAVRLRAELMADYRRWQDELEAQLRAELDRVWDAWTDEFDGRSWTDDEGVRHWEADVAFPKDGTVLEFLRLLPTSEVLDAVRIAGWRWGKRRDEPIERAAVSRYFAGVCRNKARKADETARRIHVTWPELINPEQFEILGYSRWLAEPMSSYAAKEDYMSANGKVVGGRIQRDGETLDPRVRGESYKIEVYEDAIGRALEHVAVSSTLKASTVAMAKRPDDDGGDVLVRARIKREREQAALRFAKDRDLGKLEATLARLDADAAAAVARTSRIPTAAEARAYLESLPELWARTSDAGRHAIAEAVFERIDVLGANDFTFVLTAAARARGWDAAFGPGVLRLESHGGRGKTSGPGKVATCPETGDSTHEEGQSGRGERRHAAATDPDVPARLALQIEVTGAEGWLRSSIAWRSW